MPNPCGNPRIAEYGVGTQFGKPRGCPQEVAHQLAAQQRSLRHALRVACGRRIIDLDKPQITLELALAMFGYRRGDSLSMIQCVAVGLIAKAVDGDLNAAQRIEYIVDGKP